MKETYQEYINRVVPLTLPASHKAQLQNIQKSAKFVGGQPVPFPGYTVVTPTFQEDETNREFYTHLESCQNELLAQLNPGLIIPVPAASFHLTIADLIWDCDYLSALEKNPNFESMLKSRLAMSFQQFEEFAPQTNPIQLQLLGLTIFPRAIVVCLVPKDEENYNLIDKFRSDIYQNPDIIGLAIEQQYDFTAHITLGYFDEITPLIDRDKICEVLSNLNEKLIEIDSQWLTVQQIELRKFDDMNNFYREPEWPMVKF